MKKLHFLDPPKGFSERLKNLLQKWRILMWQVPIAWRGGRQKKFHPGFGIFHPGLDLGLHPGFWKITKFVCDFIVYICKFLDKQEKSKKGLPYIRDAKLNHLYVRVKKCNLFINIICSSLKNSVKVFFPRKECFYRATVALV